MHCCWHGFFTGQISSIRLLRKTVHPRAAKVCKPWAMGHALLRWEGVRLKEQSCWHGFFRTNSINAIVPKNRCQRLVKRCLNARQRDMPGRGAACTREIKIACTRERLGEENRMYTQADRKLHANGKRPCFACKNQ